MYLSGLRLETENAVRKDGCEGDDVVTPFCLFAGNESHKSDRSGSSNVAKVIGNKRKPW